MAILVTGGAGFIGSHICVELLNEGKEIIVVDNFSNSKPEVLEKIKEITGKDFKFYEVDMTDKKALDRVFFKNHIDAVIHLAGLKAVGESVEKPIEYYYNNLVANMNLLELMKNYRCKKLVFSSSATVYGTPETVPIPETAPRSTTNPYGTTKLMMEDILIDVAKADDSFRIVLLRYFNPIGAHESGLIGDNPNGIPNNLMPYINLVATGKLEKLRVFGNDYPTKDGTGVRDFIHVVDLAKGHLKALDKIENESGLFIYNLGTGTGYSVLDLVQAYENVNNVKIAYEIVERRPGDIAECYADPTKEKKELKWEATKTLEDMCKDSWNFIQKQK